MPALPIEIQILILTEVFHNTLACSPEFTVSGFPEDPVDNNHFAAAFFAAHDAQYTKRTSPVLLPEKPIGEITDTLVLRVALAVALPAWHGALRDIPALWARIAVPLDVETWSAKVLDAVQEALVCSRDEPLSILITRAPAENDEQDAGLGLDLGGEAERARVTQVMELLTPHIVRWSYLRVCTLYSAALPMPTIDFAGQAPLLENLYLCASKPALADPCKGSGSARTLDVPRLRFLTLDAHVFSSTYLHQPDALPALNTLTLYGPGMKGEDNSREGQAAMSARALLACVAKMRPLMLRLDGTHLSVGCNSVEREDGDFDPAFKCVACLHCERLPAAVLGELLTLSSDNYDDSDLCQLEIIDCGLPNFCPLENYGAIELTCIPASENIGLFLESATSCESLALEDCPSFSINYLFPQLGQWLLPRLEFLTIENCASVQVQEIQEMMHWRSEWAYRLRVKKLVFVMLDRQSVKMREPASVEDEQ